MLWQKHLRVVPLFSLARAAGLSGSVGHCPALGGSCPAHTSSLCSCASSAGGWRPPQADGEAVVRLFHEPPEYRPHSLPNKFSSQRNKIFVALHKIYYLLVLTEEEPEAGACREHHVEMVCSAAIAQQGK